MSFTTTRSVSSTANKGDIMFSNDAIVRKYQYQMFLVNSNEYTMEDVVEMTMVELRAAVDELLPVVITTTSATTCGGVSKKVTVVKAA